MTGQAPNRTIANFGWPETEIASTDHWCVLLRPAQPTLGALVVTCREEATAFGAISPAAFAEFGRVVPAVETMLKAAVGYEKINWLMLMMVDPHVHFHVLPRHSAPKALAGFEARDAGWPGPPALGEAATPEPEARAALVSALRAAWPL